MVEFSFELINQIKEAADEQHLRIIIETSIRSLRRKNVNGFSANRRYMMNMEMALRYSQAEGGLHANASENVSKAITIFENLRKQEYSNLF